MIKLLYKIATLATELDIEGNFSKADKLDRLLEITAAPKWKGERSYNPDLDEEEYLEPGHLHQEELYEPTSHFESTPPEPSMAEEMEEGGLTEREPHEAGLGGHGSATWSNFVHQFKHRLKPWLAQSPILTSSEWSKSRPSAKKEALLKVLHSVLDELSKKSTKMKYDPEYEGAAHQLVNEVIQEMMPN